MAEIRDLTPLELVRRAQAGSRPCFAALVERHEAPLYRFLLARVGDRCEAEDLCQDTFLRAFEKLGSGGQATIDVVGPDISHALIATAVGLAAAIPAVVAFNYFNTSVRVLHTEMDNFSADFLNIVKRHVS